METPKLPIGGRFYEWPVWLGQVLGALSTMEETLPQNTVKRIMRYYVLSLLQESDDQFSLGYMPESDHRFAELMINGLLMAYLREACRLQTECSNCVPWLVKKCNSFTRVWPRNQLSRKERMHEYLTLFFPTYYIADVQQFLGLVPLLSL